MYTQLIGKETLNHTQRHDTGKHTYTCARARTHTHAHTHMHTHTLLICALQNSFYLGNSLLLPSDSDNSTVSHPGPINSSREELQQEIATVESQIDSAVNSEDFELAGILCTLSQITGVLSSKRRINSAIE